MSPYKLKSFAPIYRQKSVGALGSDYDNLMEPKT